ncbi:hypothetical protein DB30_07297 [Enhygromyxa salina]|uniref:Uncharacterized protein n=1 Tax=Enhygromyxa salina TaxID=215803 RepID=A0A0C2CWN2_9BACT|nr:hypothetical protein [Enhygromyxa salina]KIG14030.1 hypothetical protein DB30_07297 [Enhygromyxa salina]
MRRSYASTAISLTAVLILGPLQLGATPAFAQAPTAADDSQLAEAKALNKEAEIKFQTAEYEEALALWKQAFAILPDGVDTRTIRNGLVYNIASAHIRAYDVSRNQMHLRKAKILLQNYRDEHVQLYGDDPAALEERASTDERLAEVEQKLAESEAKGETAVPLDDPSPEPVVDPATQPQPQPQSVPPPKPLTPQMIWEEEVKADPVLGPKWAKGRSQVVGGIVLTSIGSLFLIGTVAMIGLGANLRATSETTCDPVFDTCTTLDGTGAFVTGGVLGVIGLSLAAPGAALIAVGAKRRGEVKKAKPRPVSLVPYLNPKHGSGGMTFTLQF